MKKLRLDQRVFDLNLTESRERAKTSIMTGCVYVNGQKVDKPGTPVTEYDVITLVNKALPFVSRGGYKLDKALRVFDLSPDGFVCMDCGASTGGFTDVLLQNGAKKVYCVDVGYGQLAWKLRNDEKVVNLERTNLRDISRGQIPELIDMAVIDVSFISLKLILPAIKPLLKDSAPLVCLIKPQFEAGREFVGKNGVVRDKAVHISVVKDIIDYASSIGYCLMGLDFSPIKGPEGNIEYLCYLINTAEGQKPVFDLDAIVDASHKMK